MPCDFPRCRGRGASFQLLQVPVTAIFCDTDLKAPCIMTDPALLKEVSIAPDLNPVVSCKYLSWEIVLPEEHEATVERIRDPTKWPAKEKHFVAGLSILTTFMAAYSISAYVSGVDSIATEFESSHIVALVGMPTFQTAFAAAPMVLAPFSEFVGRKPVFLSTYILYSICTLIIAVVDNLPGLLVARFFQGVGASTFSTMVGGVIADIYQPHERGIPMSLFATASFSGGMGQLVSNFIFESKGWRWIYWHQLLINIFLMVLIALFFQECRGPVLLSKRAKILNSVGFAAYNERSPPPHITWKVKEEEERATLKQMIRISLTRPFHLLFTEPVVFWFSMWISFSWALLFMFYVSVPLTFQVTYSFTTQQTGLVLLATIVGAIIGNLCYPFQERLYREYANKLPKFSLLRQLRRSTGVPELTTDWNPEARLYTACFLSIAMSVGMFMYGAVMLPEVHWIVACISVVMVTFGSYSVYLAVFTYFADVYAIYASSAMAAQSFCRNAVAGAMPLAVTPMFTRLGFMDASFLLGACGLLMSFVPLVLVVLGPRIRARSKFAKTLRHDDLTG
ncbi:major facilitator superfamily domain-containing protein [Apiosordaria backusii]|uniref:Major facilitator superfamily domain-containing protein n=1 Tax=Apiosordaria backusii TaxID=314023 RepID=A0AA40K445_9PEZI|nr:major facilitator superfamily domain-containing protein [Apiosordaria backusii]